MYRLTIDQAAHRPAVLSTHPDPEAAAAALADYLSAQDCEPIPNQVTTTHRSYDLLCLAQQRVVTTATIELAEQEATAA
ncbi:hypothetical protein [Mycolicibacterium llatzerense]|uniref:hypothetical protein n=1 Tax=Mycolicibacterium llatzerense TaxID=280871 RepID=UPI0021B6AD87|nr:hypothetical protein [Mycolicibacterium llatzerense]MCT7367287.1 hypothetical protein [Mycolicibacterium llatzerense]